MTVDGSFNLMDRHFKVRKIYSFAPTCYKIDPVNSKNRLRNERTMSAVVYRTEDYLFENIITKTGQLYATDRLAFSRVFIERLLAELNAAV